MNRFSWILGLGVALLVACGVESPPASPPDETAVTEAVSRVAEPASDLAPLAVQPAAACAPVGDDRPCCPFPQGCSCDGDQVCKPNGQWGICAGAGRAGQPCP